MKLNPDLYHALAQEYVTTKHNYEKVPNNTEKPEFRTKFMLSGKELLTALYTIISKTNYVQFSKTDYSKVYRMCNSKFHRYKITERIVTIQGNYVDISTFFDYTYVEPTIRWALSSTKKVVCSDNTPLSKDVVELLLLNDNFKELTLERCDLVSAKMLVESRNFRCITVGDRMHKGWRRFRINAEVLKLNFDSFQNIVSSNCMNIDTVSIDCHNEDIVENIRKLGLCCNRSTFQTVEFNTKIISISENIEKILLVIYYLSEAIFGMKFLTFNFCESESYLPYYFNGTASRPPDSFQKFVKYKEKLSKYNGEVKVQLNHCIPIELSLELFKNDEKYVEKLKQEFQGFDYSSEICDIKKFHYFKKSYAINENLVLHVTYLLKQLIDTIPWDTDDDDDDEEDEWKFF